MFHQRLPFLVAAVAVAFALFTHTASADSYGVISLGTDNSGRIGIYGIDTSGDVVESYFGTCTGPLTNCYLEYSPAGVPLGVTTVPPSLAYDDGTPCTGALPAGFISLGGTICNNGREIIAGAYTNAALYATLCGGPTSGLAEQQFCSGGGYFQGIFTGSDPFADWLNYGGSGGLKLNAAGDFAFDDARTDVLYLALDATPSTTPEPGTMELVATGSLALFWILRRRAARA